VEDAVIHIERARDNDRFFSVTRAGCDDCRVLSDPVYEVSDAANAIARLRAEDRGFRAVLRGSLLALVCPSCQTQRRLPGMVTP
jgi:hypothetical protein